MVVRLVAFAFLLAASLIGQVFLTGPPAPSPDAYSLVPLLSPEAYDKLQRNASTPGSTLVFVRKLPPAISSNHWFGHNFVYQAPNQPLKDHVWILDRSPSGDRLYVDLTGQGDFSTAQPVSFHLENGLSTAIVQGNVDGNHGSAAWVASFKLRPDAKAPGGVAVMVSTFSMRDGEATVNGSRIPFRLVGSSGHYTLLGDHVLFDRTHSGRFDRYSPNARWVNLAGKTYGFEVDPNGDSLTLRLADQQIPDRPSLEVGSRVPDVTVTDLDGRSHHLTRNTAQTTLLEFWNTYCGPCRQEMPELKVFRDKLPRAKFDIIGVSNDESLQELKTYLGQLSIDWPESRESLEGPVHSVFRIEGFPTYFLLAEDGTILDHWLGSGQTIQKLQSALSRR